MFSILVFSCKTDILPSTTYLFCFIILPLMLYVTLYLFKRSFCFLIFSKVYINSMVQVLAYASLFTFFTFFTF